MRQTTVVSMMSLLWAGLLAPPSAWGAPSVGGVWVTDVTPRSFAVQSVSDEPVAVRLEVFLDEDGLATAGEARSETPASGDAAVEAGARARGIAGARAVGLTQGRRYFYRLRVVSLASGEETLVPGTTPLPEVPAVGAVRNTVPGVEGALPTANHLLLDGFFADDAETPSTGALVMGHVEGSAAAVSALVGGADGALGVLDLNNVFEAEGGPTQLHVGGELIRVRTVRGAGDVRTRGFLLPEGAEAGRPYRPVPILQSLTLRDGWNFVALQVEPEHLAIEEVFFELWDQIEEIRTFQDGEWLGYDRTTGDGELLTVRPNQGYLVRTTGGGTLTATGGWQLDAVALVAGWNLVGFRELTPMPVAEALAPLAGYYRVVWGYDAETGQWHCYQPGLPDELNDLAQIEPGTAYYIEMSAERGW